jgi:hypothetical protein
MEHDNVYVVKAELINQRLNFFEKSNFEFVFRVNLTGKAGENATFYDPELKIRFEDKSALRYFYQIDMQHVHLCLPPRLQKSSDFMRRLFYVYDWIEFEVDSKGKVRSVENIKEIQSGWKEIKTSLERDYTGDIVRQYLQDMDEKINGASFVDTASCYLNFGLIFLQIPPEHDKEWSSKRWIRCSGYEEKEFEEQITFVKMIDKSRKYAIGVLRCRDEETVPGIFEGEIHIDAGELFPSTISANIEYINGTMLNRWQFIVEKY